MILVLLIFFVGKQVIHPNQIAVVQEQFSPSPEKIKWAQELISAFEEHQRLGKREARLTVVKTLEEFDFGHAEKCVRINSVSSGLAEQDLEVLLQSRTLPSSMMLPKVENVEEIRWFSDKFSHHLKQRLSVGSIPRCMVVVLEDDLVDSCKSGDDITVYGVVMQRWKPFHEDARCDLELVLKANYVKVNNEQLAGVMIVPGEVSCGHGACWWCTED